MHFLLLNPPGRMRYSRDYFCSKVTKAGYAEHPVDLLILSGTISSAGHRVSVVDAIVENLDFSATEKLIESLHPDILIFLSGSTSWKDDFDFLFKIKRSHPQMLFAGLGDIFLEEQFFINHTWIDAVILDFTSCEILAYAEGQRENFKSLGFRDKGKFYFPEKSKPSEEFTIALPRHDLFLRKRYSFPFAKRLPFATLLTDYGCPFQCRFCIYPTLGFKLRSLDNVLAELKQIHSLGISELFIKDQSFAANKERTLKLCEEMRKIGKFSWTCFLRTDLAEEGLLRAMKKAGCHTVMLGVESANPEILSKYKPGVTQENIKAAFKLCRKIGIDTVGIFILGFPGEDEKSVLATIDLALELKCDFASFNVYVPKLVTPLRKDLISQHLIDDSQLDILDQSGIASVWHNEYLKPQELGALRRLAIRKFYFRPFYLAKMLLKKVLPLSRLPVFLNSLFFIMRDANMKKPGPRSN
ncbi:MAG: radical SAM protein [Candidatus Omnitrophica bacterium]|nr:radical SAM protein [Candidatus Omnitrophota bacterium]